MAYVRWKDRWVERPNIQTVAIVKGDEIEFRNINVQDLEIPQDKVFDVHGFSGFNNEQVFDKYGGTLVMKIWNGNIVSLSFNDIQYLYFTFKGRDVNGNS